MTFLRNVVGPRLTRAVVGLRQWGTSSLTADTSSPATTNKATTLATTLATTNKVTILAASTLALGSQGLHWLERPLAQPSAPLGDLAPPP